MVRIDGRKVKKLREQSDWTQGQLAYISKVDQSVISRIENDAAPDVKLSTVGKLAGSFGVPVRELLSEAPGRQAILIPRLGPVSATPSPGAPSEPQFTAYFPKPEERNHTFTTVIVKGTCMEPILHDGEEAVVNMSVTPRPGDVVLARHEGEMIIKRLQRSNGSLILVATNAVLTLPITEETEIIGVVRSVTRDI